MSVLKIASTAVCAVFFAMVLKNAGSQLYVLVTMAVSVLIIIAVAGKISGIISQITKLSSYLSNAGQYMALMIKIIGITYVVQFTSDLCRDSGYSALAGQVEVFGKITIAAVSIPVVACFLRRWKNAWDIKKIIVWRVSIFICSIICDVGLYKCKC